MRSPLYNWTHFELKQIFDISKAINKSKAEKIFNECNEKLRQSDFSVRPLTKLFNVEIVSTNDDPIDTLEHRHYIKDNPFRVKIHSTWKADKVMAVE